MYNIKMYMFSLLMYFLATREETCYSFSGDLTEN